MGEGNMLPLSGVKVVETAQNLAGPFAGEMLAYLGAEVVDVELIGPPIPFDGVPPAIHRRTPGLGEHNDGVIGGRAP